MSPPSEPSLPPELGGVFRPRAARVVSGVLSVAAVIGAFAAVIGLRAAQVQLTPGAATGAVATVVIVVLVCWRQYQVVAVPDAGGLLVRNLVQRRYLRWQEIVSVRYGEHSPWAQLDLADATTLAVMGIQRADGEHARREARRLATLVALYEGGEGASRDHH